MKKLSYLWMWLFMLVVATGFVSCSEDDDKGGGGNVPQELLGSWNVYVGETLTFNANGTLVWDYGDGDVETYSYFYDAENKTITFSGYGESETWRIVTLTNSKLVVIEEEGYEITFTKVGASDEDDDDGDGDGDGDNQPGVSGPDYDTSEPADLPDATLYAEVSGKYNIGTTDVPYSSIELTADGYYIVEKTSSYAYGVKAMARKTTKVESMFQRRSAIKRSYENESLITGSFMEIGEGEYELENFGTLKVTGRDADNDVTSFELDDNTGGSVAFAVDKAANEAEDLTGNSGNLCRMWRSVESRAQYYYGQNPVYDAIYSTDADEVTTYVNQLNIDWREDMIFDDGGDALTRVLFSQAGTYLMFFRDGSMEQSYWRWVDKENGIICAYDLDGESSTPQTTFYGNRVNIVEEYSEIVDAVEARSVYTEVLEAM